MGKFYNRKRELASLNQWWKERESHMVIIYGKRRVGKTALSLKFIEKKAGIYFLSERLDPQLQLRKISQEIGQFFKDDFIAQYGFIEWEQLFKYIANRNKKFVFINYWTYLKYGEDGLWDDGAIY